MRSRVFPLIIISVFTPICLIAQRTPRSTQAALTSASQQQQEGVRKDAPETCPVTKPPAEPFVPPLPYWTDHGPDGFWYGTESLWTLLSVQGTRHIHNNVLESEGRYRTKLTYWRRGFRGFDWRKPELTVIAKRLDRQAPSVAADPAHAVFVATKRLGMMTGIDLPSIGCWKITARYRGDELSFVVLVRP